MLYPLACNRHLYLLQFNLQHRCFCTKYNLLHTLSLLVSCIDKKRMSRPNILSLWIPQIVLMIDRHCPDQNTNDWDNGMNGTSFDQSESSICSPDLCSTNRRAGRPSERIVFWMFCLMTIKGGSRMGHSRGPRNRKKYLYCWLQIFYVFPLA